MLKSLNNFDTSMNASGEPHAESSLVWRASFVMISSLLAAFIVAGNCLVITAFATKPRLRTATYKFLVSLAISDLLVGSVSIPLWIYLNYTRRSVAEEGAAGIFPNVFKYFDIFSAMASIFHLVAICIERHIAITRPFTVIPALFYHLMIAVAWIFALILSLIWELEFLKFYAIVGFLIGFLVPMAVITLVYGNILRIARALIHRTPELRRSNRIREERKVVVTVLLVAVLFALCWLPFFLTSIIAQFNVLSEKQRPQLLITLVKWLQYSNSALNPIIYAFRDREMRDAFRSLLKQLLPTHPVCARNLYAQQQGSGFELKQPAARPEAEDEPKVR